MKINIYDTFLDHRLETAWSKIVDSYGYFIQNSFIWCQTWWKYFKNDKRDLYIVTAEENNEIIGIAPLYVEHRKFFTLLRFLGSPLTDFHELIITKGRRYEEIFNFILNFLDKFEVCDAILFEQINNEGFEYGLLEKKLEKKFVIECPIIEFGGLDWQTYINSLQSRNLRRDFKKKSRKLERDFNIDLKYVGHKDEFASYIGNIAQLHIDRWDKEDEDSKFKSENLVAFLKEVFSSLMCREKAAMYILFGDGKIFAYRLGFIEKETFFDWNTSFDPDYRLYSPGKIITGYVIKKLIERGFKRFHFMRGAYSYKKEWMPINKQHISGNYLFVMAKSNAKGYLIKGYYLRWRDSIKSIFSKLLKNRIVRRILRLDKY